MNSFYSQTELLGLGFKAIGNNCLISRKASFYNIGDIRIGNNVRIDDFCILSGEIVLGSYIHISAFCALYGSKGIYIDDFSGVSPNSIIYSAVDDFSGNYLINPMVPKEYTNVTGGKVIIEKYVQLGTNTIVMPNIRISEGATTGAFTFVNKAIDAWCMYFGIPARKKGIRKKNILSIINNFEQ